MKVQCSRWHGNNTFKSKTCKINSQRRGHDNQDTECVPAVKITRMRIARQAKKKGKPHDVHKCIVNHNFYSNLIDVNTQWLCGTFSFRIKLWIIISFLIIKGSQQVPLIVYCWQRSDVRYLVKTIENQVFISFHFQNNARYQLVTLFGIYPKPKVTHWIRF